MAAQVCFVRKNETTEMNFVDLDAEIARHFGDEPDPIDWYHNWYNTICFGIACNNTQERLLTIFSNDEKAVAIINYLYANFDVNAYYC